MSYRNRNSGCGGCIGQLLAIVLLSSFFWVKECYNSTQFGMIRKARDEGNVFNYHTYLEKYPSGRFSVEAYDSIMSILRKNPDNNWIFRYMKSDNKISEKLSFIAYDYALLKNDTVTWVKYINNAPPAYLKDATYKLDSLRNDAIKREAQKWGKESAAWNTASDMDTYEGYLKYAELYPKGKHYHIAKKKIIDYEVARDFAGRHGDMPSMEKTSYSKGNYAHLTIENKTSHTLTLLYSGNISERLVIPSYSIGNIRLPNGSYRISARVDATNVIPFVGREDLSGGDYSVSYYISTTRY